VGGKATVDFSGRGDQARSVLLRSNGQIILAGFTSTSTHGYAGLARLNSNGSLDTTFGQGGRVVSDFSSEGWFTGGGLIQLDPICGCEKVITSGTVINGGIYYAFATRYLL
jgi:hypothetical protein